MHQSSDCLFWMFFIRCPRMLQWNSVWSLGTTFCLQFWPDALPSGLKTLHSNTLKVVLGYIAPVWSVKFQAHVDTRVSSEQKDRCITSVHNVAMLKANSVWVWYWIFIRENCRTSGLYFIRILTCWFEPTGDVETVILSSLYIMLPDEYQCLCWW